MALGSWVRRILPARAEKLAADTYRGLFVDLDKGDFIGREVLAAIRATGGLEYSRERAHHYATLAEQALDDLPASDALAAVEALLGPHYLISNFSANIALPGSKSMRLHSDQSLVIPPPWTQVLAMNIIWCLDDVHADNGATLYLPGSHHFQTPDEVPADALSKMRPFEAPAGSFIAMDGRLWHTSGSNITADQQRRMMFAYYSADFIRLNIFLTDEFQSRIRSHGYYILVYIRKAHF